MATHWDLTFLGSFKAVASTGHVVSRLDHEDLAGLLFRLASVPGVPWSNEALIDFLQLPGGPSAQLSRLRELLTSLQALLEPEPNDAGTILELSADSAEMVPGACDSDAARFVAAIHSAGSARGAYERADALEAVAAIYTGRFLPDYQALWARHRRAELDGLFGNAMCGLAAAYGQQGKPRKVQEALRRLRSLHPRGRSLATVARLRNQESAGAPLPVIGPPNPLPSPSRLIGRSDKIEEFRRLVQASDSRLVTLCGPVGVGKTHLALHLATEANAAGTPTWLVELSHATDAPEMEEALIAGLPPGSAQTGGPIDWVRAAMGEGPGLLVVDAPERVVEPIRALIGRLLVELPPLRVLVASRESIGLTTERVIALDTFAIPGSEAGRQHPDLWPAVSLFLDRARISAPQRICDLPGTVAIVSICKALGGLPHAIALVAEGCSGQAPGTRCTAAAADLRRLAKVESQEPPGPLELALRWRLAGLGDEVAAAYPLLSVFAGSFLAADAAVILWLESPEEALGRLADASLLVSHTSDSERRFRVPRALADLAEQLAPDGALAAARRAHGMWFLGEERSSDDGPSLAADIPDLVAAIEWGALHEPELALHCLVRRHWFLSRSRRGSRAIACLDELLERATEVAEYDRAVAHTVADSVCAEAGKPGDAERHSLAACRIGIALGDPLLVGAARVNLGLCRSRVGDQQGARRLCEEGLRDLRRAGKPSTLAQALAGYGGVLVLIGELGLASDAIAESQDLYADLADHYGAADALHNRAELAMLRRRMTEAEDLFRRVIKERLRLGDDHSVPGALGAVAGLAGAKGQYERALVLYQAAASLRQQMGMLADTVTEAAELAGMSGAVRRLGILAITTAMRRGSSLALVPAAAYAMESESEPPTPGVRGGYRDVRPGELEVVRCASRIDNTSDAAISADLVISASTVKTHWRNLMARLDIHSRPDVMVYAREHGWLSPDDDEQGSDLDENPDD